MEYALILQAIHIIAVIAWMAGLLYLPRLYVYHTQAKKGGELDETLKVMERRLLRFIMNPAMIVTLIAGILLMRENATHFFGWFHAKSFLLIGMFAAHGMMAKYRKDFEKGTNTKSARFFRFFNEVPTVLMVIIVVLAVVKPF